MTKLTKLGLAAATAVGLSAPASAETELSERSRRWPLASLRSLR